MGEERMNTVGPQGTRYVVIDPGQLEARQAYRLQTSIIVPRPIAWVGTIGPDGVPNCAPFSYFMGISSHPPVIAFAVGERRTGVKDTVRNLEQVAEFTVNIVTEAQAEVMVRTSADYPYGVSEFDALGLEALPSLKVRAPRIGGSPVQMECRVLQQSKVPETKATLIVGRVMLVHVDGAVLDEETGKVDIGRLKPVGRLGGTEYCRIGEVFTLERPSV
jgi:flavin reductase (DIM6/NTAB) family NADH-FMN oxidoreductase RutF